jgi:hypothetical protein
MFLVTGDCAGGGWFDSSLTQDRAAEKKLFSPYMCEADGENPIGEKWLWPNRLRETLTLSGEKKRAFFGRKLFDGSA